MFLKSYFRYLHTTSANENILFTAKKYHSAVLIFSNLPVPQVLNTGIKAGSLSDHL